VAVSQCQLHQSHQPAESTSARRPPRSSRLVCPYGPTVASLCCSRCMLLLLLSLYPLSSSPLSLSPFALPSPCRRDLRSNGRPSPNGSAQPAGRLRSHAQRHSRTHNHTIDNDEQHTAQHTTTNHGTARATAVQYHCDRRTRCLRSRRAATSSLALTHRRNEHSSLRRSLSMVASD